LVRCALGATDARVVVFDKLTYAGSLDNLADVAGHPRFELVQGDLADGAALGAFVAALRPTAIVNLAAETHVDRSIDDPRPFFEANTRGVFELLEAARALHGSLGPEERARFRLVHVSTDEVYGSLGPAGAFTEASPYAPNSPYAATKAAGDHLVRAYHATYGLPALTTGCSNNYGPYQYPEKLVPVMITRALAAEPLPIYGDGGNVRDWIHVEDHCRGVLRALEAGKPGERYLFGANEERTNVQMVDAICAALERVAPAAENAALAARGLRAYAALKTFVADRPGHDRRYAIDSTKARAELGWHPARELAPGLEETARWYGANYAWCARARGRAFTTRAREPG
jgi:dTDP-glucose 4,6-dehydratase